jgi:hypothetical protein
MMIDILHSYYMTKKNGAEKEEIVYESGNHQR